MIREALHHHGRVGVRAACSRPPDEDPRSSPPRGAHRYAAGHPPGVPPDGRVRPTRGVRAPRGDERPGAAGSVDPTDSADVPGAAGSVDPTSTGGGASGRVPHRERPRRAPTVASVGPSGESWSGRRARPVVVPGDAGPARDGSARRAGPRRGWPSRPPRSPVPWRGAPRSRRRASGREPARGWVRDSRPRWRVRDGRAAPPRRSVRVATASLRASAWAPREHCRDAGRRRRRDGGCGRPGPPRWRPTRSRRRCPVARRGRATPCSSSRVP